MFNIKETEIEERIGEVRELLQIWMRFYRILSAGFDPENLSDEKEKEFQSIKTIVAQRHRHFMQVITDDEDKFIGQNILNLVKRVISLREFGKLSSLEINKISIEWHDANILLNEILGTFEFQLEMAKKGITISNVPGAVKDARKAVAGEKKKKAASQAPIMLAAVVVIAAIGAAVVFWDQIQASPFYQEYLASYVDLIKGIFGSES